MFRSPAILTGLLWVLSLATGRLLAADWPEWRGPGRAGRWEGVSLPGKLDAGAIELLWSASLGGGYSGVAVVGHRVVTMDRPKGKPIERIACLDRATGKTLWAHEYAADYGDMAYGNGPRCTPTVRDGRIFTQGAVGHAYALDLESGKVLWKLDVAKTHGGKIPEWGYATSPLVFERLVLVQAGGAPGPTLIALDTATGQERWKALNEAPGYSSPVVIEQDARQQVAFWSAESVVGLDPASGQVLWRVPYKSTYAVAIASPVLDDGILLVSGFWEGSKAVRLHGRKEPEEIWSGKNLSCLMSTPLLRDGHLYALDKSLGLLAIEWKTGKVIWSDEHRVTPRERNPQASMVWAGSDRAMILNARGELILARLRPGGYEEQGRVKVSADTWSHPAFSGQDIFVRAETEVSCWRLKSSGASK